MASLYGKPVQSQSPFVDKLCEDCKQAFTIARSLNGKVKLCKECRSK